MEDNIQKSQIVIYKTEEGQIKIHVRFENETVWLSQKALAELFQTTKNNISLHVKNIFEEGAREVSRNIEYYNLDLIISVGYRIKSSIATAFRQWANQILKKFTIRGYVLDDVRLKNGAYLSKQYFKDLILEIRDIREMIKVNGV